MMILRLHLIQCSSHRHQSLTRRWYFANRTRGQEEEKEE